MEETSDSWQSDLNDVSEAHALIRMFARAQLPASCWRSNMTRDIEPRVIEANLPVDGWTRAIPEHEAAEAEGGGVEVQVRFEPELLA
jgi:hypothetical protein